MEGFDRIVASTGEPLIAIIFLFGVILAVALFFNLKTPTALSPTEFRKFKLSKIEKISHDTRRFTFALQTSKTKLGLPIGQHITFKFTDDEGKGCQRSYTPITGDETPGEVVFVIKVYKAGVHPKFPLGGKMSQHLDSLKIGDQLEMKGPKGHLTYLNQGKFTVKLMRKPLQTRQAKHFGFIAGGTGITPIFQVCMAILRDTGDKTTTMSIIYANQTEQDILLRSELELLAKEYPNRFKLHYTLDRPPAGWSYSSGFIDKDMIEAKMPKASPDGSSQILMCGPPPMLKYACLPNLEALGYKETDIFSF